MVRPILRPTRFLILRLRDILAAGLAVALCAAAAPVFAADDLQIAPLDPGSVTVADGLDAWSRIYEVATHPRCANCHVGTSDRPMWSGAHYGKTRPHGMNIRAGASRIGAETVLCSSCHGKANSPVEHGPPGNAMGWMLAPVEAAWFGASSAWICEQLRDPARNGGRDTTELAQHLGHDEILRWAWAPGPGRAPAPYSLQAHIDDLLQWGAAGTPCPD